MRSSFRGAAGLALLLGFSALAPMACLSGYVFDLPPGAGGSTSSTTVSGMPSTSTVVVGSSSGNGGNNANTSSTSSSPTNASSGSAVASSSSGAPACSERDCSNPACAQSFSCVPTTPPTGWTGYFELYDGSPTSLPTCAGDWPTQGYQGGNNLTGDPAACNCQCTPPSGGACQIPALNVNDEACGTSPFCVGTPPLPAPYTPGNCFNFPAPGSGYYQLGGTGCGVNGGPNCTAGGSAPCAVSAKAGLATVSGSTCVASANPTTTQPSFGGNGQACGGPTPGTGCGASDSCLPIPQAPFNGGLCIMQTGDVQCPAVQFTHQHLFYATYADTRSCTGCTCGTATGESCGVTWSLYTDGSSPPSCESLSATIAAGDCVALSGNPSITSAKATITQQPTGGLCPPSAGTPTGGVAGSMPTTFCCTM